MSEKVCSKCREEKPVTDFSKHTRMWDGLRAYCKKCANADASKRWHANLEVSREKCRAARQKKNLPKPVALAPAPPGTKRCGVCRTVKRPVEFHRNKNEPDNLSWMCRACDSQRGRLAREKKWAEEGRIFAKPGHKICPGCSTEKEHSNFGRHYRTPDKLCCYCKFCRSAQKGLSTAKKWVDEGRVFPELGKKFCAKCKEQHPLELFKPRKDVEGGRGSYCPRCRTLRSRLWHVENIDQKRENARAWARRNPHKSAAKSSRRNAAKAQRTPKWLTAEDYERMESFYLWAKIAEKEMNEPFHVDHIYPLRGRYVSGLHVPSNLQILSASENCKKSNIWIPE